MVDSGASSNVMPYSMCKKLNAKIQPCTTQIVQLDRSNVRVLGELKEVLIRLSSDPRVHQIIDIIVADIPEVYGLFLSRDWSKKLNGYFATDWSHLWLPYNGRPNSIKIDRENYMKYTVTQIDDLNQPVMQIDNILGNYGIDTYFGNFQAEKSAFSDLEQQSKILSCSHMITPEEEIIPEKIVDNSVNTDFWFLYFDGSKCQEGAGAGCILVDPSGNKMFISCRLEFECTNNVAEYEALLQGLKKAIDLNVKFLHVFGDSEIVVRQVNNTIHCVSPHLQAYRSEVRDLILKFQEITIDSIPRYKNQEADLLANVASKLIPVEGFMEKAFSVELIFRPSVPDNVTNWRVFDDDQQIVDFLHMKDTFQDVIIDEIQHERDLTDASPGELDKLKEQLNGQVKSIPKSVVRMEKFYDFQDKFKKVVNCKTNSSSMSFEIVNLGTDE
ncbi:MAG: reverse transcriptase-like protein, partial [bacterium]|nr:reverse transcriptase-like protein [bacterium]